MGYISNQEKTILQFMDKEVERQKYLYSLCLAQLSAMHDKVLLEHDKDKKEFKIDINTGKIIKI